MRSLLLDSDVEEWGSDDEYLRDDPQLCAALGMPCMHGRRGAHAAGHAPQARAGSARALTSAQAQQWQPPQSQRQAAAALLPPLQPSAAQGAPGAANMGVERAGSGATASTSSQGRDADEAWVQKQLQRIQEGVEHNQYPTGPWMDKLGKDQATEGVRCACARWCALCAWACACSILEGAVGVLECYCQGRWMCLQHPRLA